MTLLVEVFKRVQLFFVAFSLAASSALLAGMASDRPDPTAPELSMVERFARDAAADPTLVDQLAEVRVAAISTLPVK